jgi:hypothetical protein
MLDINASKIAQMEHERRVRSLIPVQDHSDWVKDDRQLAVTPILAGIAAPGDKQPGRLAKQAQRLLAIVGLGAQANAVEVAREAVLQDQPC